MTLITKTSDLDDLCARLRSAEFLTVDTEFMREHTYYPQLCLIQVADDREAVAIDPLSNDLDLTPFLELMADKTIPKVLHACRQDLEIFVNLMDKVPEPIFDTQVAAMVCGFGDSVGYETLVNKITRQSVDKSARYTDWARRPLTERQLSYALSDVTYLRDIYRFLVKTLEKTDRSHWVGEEMAYLARKDIYQMNPDDMWTKLKPRSTKPRFLGILRELAAWREREAIERDIPRRRILKDEVILELAAAAPTTLDMIDRTRGIHSGFVNSKAGKTLLAAIEKGRNIPENDLPTKQNQKMRPPTPPIAELLKVLLKLKCQEAGVASKLVANAADIEAWSAQPTEDFIALKGWRGEIFGNDAKKLLAGELALTADTKGRVEIVEIEP